jgi:hypothetical protein
VAAVANRGAGAAAISFDAGTVFFFVFFCFFPIQQSQTRSGIKQHNASARSANTHRRPLFEPEGLEPELAQEELKEPKLSEEDLKEAAELPEEAVKDAELPEEPAFLAFP